MEESAAHFAPPSIDQSITTEEALDELERVLADPQFQSTERNKKFLRFVAEELFQGHESSVKAYSIAVDVFGRPSSFDPAIDPIVRIEATRLRASLTRYYELHGRDGGIRIDLPKGRYIPTFTRLELPVDTAPERSAAGAESRLDNPPARRGASSSRLWPARPARWTAVALGLLGAVGLATFLAPGAFNQAGGPRVISEKPSVEIQMKLAGNDLDDEALRLRDALMVALSQFQTLQVASAELPRVEKADPIQTSSIYTTKRNSYHVVLKYSADRDARSVWWQVIDPVDGEALSSGTERVNLSSPFKPVDETLVESPGNALGRGPRRDQQHRDRARNGKSDDRQRMRVAGVSGLRAPPFRNAGDRPDLPRGDAGAASERSGCECGACSRTPEDRPAGRPDGAVATGVEARRQGGRSRALFGPQRGRPDGGAVSGGTDRGRRHGRPPRHGAQPQQRRHPGQARQHPLHRRQMGRRHTAGHKGRSDRDRPLRDAEITLAMDAYRRGEYDEALLRLEQMGKTDCFCANVLRAATLGQLGRKQEAEAAAESLRISRGRFEKSFRKDMEARRFAPVIIASLEAGLAKAGISVK